MRVLFVTMRLILTLYRSNWRYIVKIIHFGLLWWADSFNFLIMIFIILRERDFCLAFRMLTRVRSLRPLILLTLPLYSTDRLSISWLKQFARLRTKLLLLCTLSHSTSNWPSRRWMIDLKLEIMVQILSLMRWLSFLRHFLDYLYILVRWLRRSTSSYGPLLVAIKFIASILCVLVLILFLTHQSISIRPFLRFNQLFWSNNLIIFNGVEYINFWVNFANLFQDFINL
jgi:hypothetical protein